MFFAGNFNGRESDDILGRDGQRYLDVDDLGSSWRLDSSPDEACVAARLDSKPRSTAAEHKRRRTRRQRPSVGRSRGTAIASRGPTTCLGGTSLDDIRRHCAVLKSSRFRRCHARVDFTHYYR